MKPTIELVMVSMQCGAWEAKAIERCVQQMPEGFFASTTLFAPELTVTPQVPAFKHVRTRFLPCKGDDRYLFNVWKLRELPRHVTADFALLVADDGFIVDGRKWRDEWFEYDYIGAPWAMHSVGGNSGFSLQSKDLMQWYAVHPRPLEVEPPWFNNDSHICRVLQKDAIERGFVFAPFEEAMKFSLETQLDDCPRTLNDVFGFHGKQWLHELR